MPISSIVIAGGVNPLPELFGVSIGVFFPFAFVGMWIFVCFIISRMGWIRFATAYPSHYRPPGRSFSVPAATFGGAGARYSNVVRAVATEVGLYLYSFLLFRAFHPPFTLPWSSIDRVEAYSFLWSRGYMLHIKDEAGSFQMHVGHKLADELRRFVPHLFPPIQQATFG
jgi:hypothetical protein